MAEEKLKQKRRWFNLVAPKLFNNQIVGQTIIKDPNKIYGRIVDINLMTILNDPKKDKINIKFKIYDVQGEKALLEIIGYSLIPSFLRRRIGKNRKKIEDSFICETKDGKKLRIKTFLLTSGSTKKSVLTKIRKEVKDFISQNFKKKNYDEIIKDVIFYKLQKDIKERVKRIFPLTLCEIKFLRIIEKKKEKTKSKEEKKKTSKEKSEKKTEKTEPKETRDKKQEKTEK